MNPFEHNHSTGQQGDPEEQNPFSRWFGDLFHRKDLPEDPDEEPPGFLEQLLALALNIIQVFALWCLIFVCIVMVPALTTGCWVALNLFIPWLLGLL